MHLDGSVEPALAGPHGGLRLDHHQRDAIDEQHEVGPLFGGARSAGILRRDDVLVPFDLGEVEQVDRDVFAVRAKGERPFAGEPGSELLVGLDEAVTADAHQDGAEPVDDVVGAVGLGGDVGVEPDQRLAQVIFDEDLVRLARDILLSEVVPAEAGNLPAAAGEARAGGSVVRDAPAQPIADEGFDGVAFSEGHV